MAPSHHRPWRLVSGVVLFASGALAAPSVNKCPEPFSSISASDFVQAINPGWNLGNTLDAPDEGAWNNPRVVPATFDDVKAAGFKSVRIPVTYTNHYTSGSPSWTIDEKWLQRVSDVVDMVTSRGLYAITNIHHDSTGWADVTKPGANISMIQEKFERTWQQIGLQLQCKSSLVAFEPINEPPATTAEHAALTNAFNSLFVTAMVFTGGYNSLRVVTLIGPGMDGAKTTQWFVPPKLTNPWALQYHYYSPYDFVMSAWGKTIWGSDSDKKSMATDLGIVRGNFSNLPIVIGEFDASQSNCEPAARWKWFDHFVRTAKATNSAFIVWDNGFDHLDRAAHKWRDPTALAIMHAALKGINNSLPDSTTDTGAATQSSSAYIYHRVGTPVEDYELSFQLNGNTLTSVARQDGAALAAAADYAIAGSKLRLKKSFLSGLVSSAALPGTKANLAVTFSAGAPLIVEVVQWDVPVFSSTTSKAAAGSDLKIPVTYKGLPRVAAVKIVRSDGSYPFDDWTKYLGPLQQGRGTFENHWKWDESGVIITSGAIQAVISGGLPTTFTFEFFPRVPGNAVNYTLTI